MIRSLASLSASWPIENGICGFPFDGLREKPDVHDPFCGEGQVGETEGNRGTLHKADTFSIHSEAFVQELTIGITVSLSSVCL